MKSKQTKPVLLRVRVDMGVMTIKRYFALPRSAELEFHNQVKSTVISRALPFLGGGQSAYSMHTSQIYQ